MAEALLKGFVETYLSSHLIFNFPLCKLYTNSLMSSLNSRKGWKYSSTSEPSERQGVNADLEGSVGGPVILSQVPDEDDNLRSNKTTGIASRSRAQTASVSHGAKKFTVSSADSLTRDKSDAAWSNHRPISSTCDQSKEPHQRSMSMSNRTSYEMFRNKFNRHPVSTLRTRPEPNAHRSGIFRKLLIRKVVKVGQ